MKSEKRHELETNVLAKRLAGWIEAVKPYTTYLVGAVGVLLGLMLVGSLWSSSSASKEAEAWDAFALAINSSDVEMQGLQRLGADDQHAGTVMQEWAYVTWADRQVFLAASSYLSNRESTKERLKPVLGIYQTLAEGASDRVVQDRARFGLARVYELRNELDQAREQYELVSGDFLLLAAEQIEKLGKPEVQADCLWLAETKLPPRMPATGPGSPGTRPDFEATLPVATDKQPVIDQQRSFEELLKELGDAAEQERYDETESPESGPTETESSETESTEESSEAEPESTESAATETEATESEPAATEQ